MFDDASEREWMQRIARGDAAAFESLFKTYEKAVGNFLYRMCYDKALAEDCLQETFLRLWKAAPNWRGESKVSTFIFQIAKNLALDVREKVFRERARGTAGTGGGEDEERGTSAELREKVAPGTGPAGEAEGAELRTAVRQALESLPEDQRMVVQLAQTEGLTYREVAEILNLPVGTVKSRMAAAAEALRRKLQRHVRE